MKIIINHKNNDVRYALIQRIWRLCEAAGCTVEKIEPEPEQLPEPKPIDNKIHPTLGFVHGTAEENEK